MQATELPRNAPMNQSFLVTHQEVRHFVDTWHFHEELELVYIKESEGRKFIGDHISTFGPGTLVLLGSYLPHSWRNDDRYYDRDDLVARSTSIFFSPTCFGDTFFDLPEMCMIRELFESAKRGLEVTGAGRVRVIRLIETFADCPDHRRPLHLLEILTTLREQAKTRQLSSPSFSSNYHQSSSTKVDVICEYVLNNFMSRITLETAADLVNMNATAFSRHFRQKTNKTFVQYVNEVRIGHACKLFSSSDASISEIAYASGFNNLSHFNKQFKAIKALTPSAYISQRAGKMS